MKTTIAVIILLAVGSLTLSQELTWKEFDGGTSGVAVYALALYKGDLIVGGFFDTAGGVPVQSIARWNGSAWSRLDRGMAGGFYGHGVRCLLEYNGDLIAGGYFDSAGGVNSKGIAMWNGGSWSSMAGGVEGSNPHVEALAVYNGKLYAGGTFLTAGGVLTVGVARWIGTGWEAVGPPIAPPNRESYFGVYAFATYNSELYLGGSYHTTNNTDSSIILKWDGSSWQPVGGGITGAIVKALTVYQGQLIVAGNFYMAGNLPVNNITAWNGSVWSSPFSTGIDNTVYTFCQIGTNLYAGGTFYNSGGNPTSMISKWDGSSWTALGTGTNAGVLAIVNYPPVPVSANIIAGGFFNTAGGEAAKHLATYGNFLGISPVTGGIPTKFALGQNYPNPFNPSTKIKFDVPQTTGDIPVKLSVYDMPGREVSVIINKHFIPGRYEVVFDGSQLSSGTYFYKLQCGSFTESKKMILVK
jgi:hypothetical protein